MVSLRDIKRQTNSWSILSTLFIILIILPNLNVFIHLFNKVNENWGHIKKYLLKDYIINSLDLVFFTGLFTVIIGTTLAFIISMYEFKGRSFYRWGLVLPLAIPPYIAAYTYNGLLNYTGVVQSFFRNYLDISVNQRHFDIMSSKGAIFIFTFVLFPYVYIITKSFLEKQSSSLIENARILGRSPLEIFIHVILPISRGAIIGGVTLVILEVLNDYGVVKYYGIPTFSTAIFKTWFSMGDVDSAIRLSAILMFIVFLIVYGEKLLRGRKKYSYSNSKVKPITRQRLTGIKGFLASSYVFIIFALSFLIPTLQLVHWAFLTYRKILNINFLFLMLNSVSLALFTSLLIITIAIIIGNFSRVSDNFISKIYSKITVMGYSIPGAVIAIGVIVFFIDVDNRFYPLYKMFNSNSHKLVLSTSITMLIFAYIIRFLSIGFNSVESGFDKVGKSFFESSRTLGMNMTQTFLKVDVKMIRPAILSGFLLVFVDILKELPLTLILRPFNFETLSTKAYQYASDEMIHEASIASLIIILVSVILIYFFYNVGDKEG